jgi:hypothetical protein
LVRFSFFAKLISFLGTLFFIGKNYILSWLPLGETYIFSWLNLFFGVKLLSIGKTYIFFGIFFSIGKTYIFSWLNFSFLTKPISILG